MQRGARVGAVLSAFLLLVSGLSTSALTAGIQISSTAIGPPEHTFGDDGAAGASARRTPIPRAAFERVRGLPARGPAAFGGDRVYDIDVDGTSYRVHEFTTVGSATLTVARALDVEYLVIGGGGGGGAWVGAGGGGGGALAGATTLNGAVAVTVGGGGVGAVYLRDSTAGQRLATSGALSSLGSSIVAAGGGHGGSWDWQNPGSAGTGGGAGYTAVSTVSPAGQGFAGGVARGAATNGYPTGGGGGAGGAGQDWSAEQAGDGGVGRASTITGAEIRYGGGGGGGIHGHSVGVDAAPGRGRDGGGDGAAINTVLLPTQNGQDGLGGGGGGGGNASNLQSFGGNGGSGIVIVRYEIPRSTWGPVASGGTITEFVGDGTNGTVDGFRYRVHTFVADDTFEVPEGGTLDEVDVLLVGGGGGGGSRHGGGGGGGGVVESSGRTVTVGSHAVTVGRGGVGMTASTPGADGEDSGFLSLVADGGGRGAGHLHGAGTGGSGGGSSSASSGANGAAGQGNSGGLGVSGSGGDSEGGWAGGGGGGAGGAGSSGTGGGSARDASAGQGGDGRTSTMSGAAQVYGGGGGGAISHRSSGIAGAAGSGGGGAGGSLGWELYNASAVGRALSWRFFLHNRNHPVNATEFDAFFAGSPHSSGSAPLVPTDQSASGTTLGTVNALNWTSAAGLTSVIGALPRTDNFAFEVTGWFVPRETGTYWFTLESDDAADLRIGGTTVASYYGGRGTPSLGTTTGSIGLVAGQAYALRARMEEVTGGEGLRVFWQTPTQRGASTTTWWQNADELIGTSPSGSPVSGPELARFIAASSRFATPRGLASVASQEAGGSATPNTLNWLKSPDNSTNDLSQADVIGVSGLSLDFMLTVAGTFVPTETGTYTFALSGDDAVDLTVDGTTIVFDYGQHAAAVLGTRTGTAALTAGVPVRIAVRHHQRDGGAELRLFWRKPSQSTGWHQDGLELRADGRDGIDGLGGGGGAGGFADAANASGGRGGDGVVIVRYPLYREVDAIPSEVREAIAGEGETTAVLRWRVPELSPPSVDLDGYRIEYAATNGNSWTALASGVTFSTSGAGSETLVTAALTGVPDASRHRFRITPRGTVDGPSTVVEPVAKGGDTVTLVGGDVVHQYTTVGSTDFTLASERSIEYLVVGGGGAGGTADRGSSGGGGGGRVVSGRLDIPGGSTVDLTVGAGGVATPTGQTEVGESGGDGGPSALVVGISSVDADGGGGGAHGRAFGTNNQGQGSTGGWTGGGGAVQASDVSSGSVGLGGSALKGGDPHPGLSDEQAAGGGAGAGSAGLNATAGNAGAGGAGLPSTITGGTVHLGGGGGGGKRTTAGGSAGAGGIGGGGVGGREAAGASGAANSGGGGGGAGAASASTARVGGAGGSGIVVLRYSFLDSGVRVGVFAATATSAVLRWEDPAVGAETITGYRVERLGPPSAEWGGATVATPTPNSTVHTLELSGLTSNAQRHFRVTALHGDRDGSTTELTVIGRGGDTVTLVGDDVVHEFTTVGTRDFELAADRTVRYLVVGGGGSGGMHTSGNRGSGGGGAGGMVAGTADGVNGVVTVAVGAGGVAPTAPTAQGKDGDSSGLSGGGLFVNALGGGGGGGAGTSGADSPDAARSGGSGGSGGGAANFNGTAGAGTAGQGRNGGAQSGDHGFGGAGGGGGGAGAAGGAASGTGASGNGGAGGAGSPSSITGSLVHYAGGGGGGHGGDGTGGTGGQGGGGVGERGTRSVPAPATSGSPGTGGGGGGARHRAPGSGGSGIVVLRYPLAP